MVFTHSILIIVLIHRAILLLQKFLFHMVIPPAVALFLGLCYLPGTLVRLVMHHFGVLLAMTLVPSSLWSIVVGQRRLHLLLVREIDC